VAGRDAVEVFDGWKAKFPDVKLTCIGRITEEPGLRLRDERGLRGFNSGGYVHFQGN
jgi:thiamine monophosphate kinase